VRVWRQSFPSHSPLRRCAPCRSCCCLARCSIGCGGSALTAGCRSDTIRCLFATRKERLAKAIRTLGNQKLIKEDEKEINMSKLFRYCLLIAVVGCLLMAQPLMADEGMKGNLVTANWLEKNLKNPDLVLLDASPEKYATGHIPGAVSVNIYELFAYGFGGRATAD